MTWLSKLRHVMQRWRRSPANERALDAELQAYLEADIEARIRRGESPTEARRRALIEFGGVEIVKENVRDARTGVWIESVFQDIRYAFRSLRKSPGFTLSLVGSLALGLSAMVVFFAFANAMIVRPTPGVREPQRVVEMRVEASDRGYWQDVRLSNGGYREIAEGFGDLGDVAASDSFSVAAALPAARMLRAAFVSGNYFDVFGAKLAIGRAFGNDRASGSADTVVLTHRLWMNDFGGDRSVIGRVIRIGTVPVEIIGVAAEDFSGPTLDFSHPQPEIWMPLTFVDRLRAAPAWPGQTARTPKVELVARLNPGVEIGQTRALESALIARLDALPDRGGTIFLPSDTSAQPESRRVVVGPLGERVRQWFAPLVALVLPVPFLVLTIGCISAANLLLARSTQREREMAVRLSIGGSRRRLIRQLLIESLVLSAASTVTAIPLVLLGRRLAEQEFAMAMPFDGFVFTLTALTTVVCAVAFGLAPALRATSKSPARGLGHSHASDLTPRQSRTRGALVVIQVALSLGLLSMGSQLIATVQSTDRVVGTPPDQLLVASFDVRPVNLSPDQANQFYTRLLARVAARPEVEAAALTSNAGIYARRAPFGPRDGASYNGGYAGGDLFGALGLRLLAGRKFTADDQQGLRPRVAVVNQVFADRVFRGSAVGQTLELLSDDQTPVPVEIVGVVAPEMSSAGRREPLPSVYVPIALSPNAHLTLYAKARTSAHAIMPAVREIVQDVDARVPIAKIGSLTDINRTTRGMELMVALSRGSTLLGAIALALAAWGLYAVMSHVVVIRSREFAVRMALGAHAPAILRLVGRQAAVLACTGAVLGTAASIAIGIILQSEWRGTPAVTFGALIVPTVILAGVMFAASLAPAARATRVDPLQLLKES